MASSCLPPLFANTYPVWILPIFIVLGFLWCCIIDGLPILFAYWAVVYLENRLWRYGLLLLAMGLFSLVFLFPRDTGNSMLLLVLQPLFYALAFIFLRIRNVTLRKSDNIKKPIIFNPFMKLSQDVAGVRKKETHFQFSLADLFLNSIGVVVCFSAIATFCKAMHIDVLDFFYTYGLFMLGKSFSMLLMFWIFFRLMARKYKVLLFVGFAIFQVPLVYYSVEQMQGFYMFTLFTWLLLFTIFRLRGYRLRKIA